MVGNVAPKSGGSVGMVKSGVVGVVEETVGSRGFVVAVVSSTGGEVTGGDVTGGVVSGGAVVGAAVVFVV
jgi:hypothetical protein